MDQTQRFFIEVLKTYLHKTLIFSIGEIDWQYFYKLCQCHNVSGIAYTALKHSKIIIPLPEKQLLETSCFAEICHSILQNEEYSQLAKAMDEERIPYLPFKGFALRRLYPHPELRTMGDIDLLIHSKDRQRCHRVLTGMGFTLTERENEWLYEKEKIRLEIHDRVKHAYGKIESSLDSNELWRRSVTEEGTSLALIEPQDHIVLLLDHMAKHAIDQGFGIRMIMDIVAVLLSDQERVDASILAEDLNKLKIFDFSLRIFALCEFLFDIKSPFNDFALEENMCKKLCLEILGNGLFGKGSDLLTIVDRDLARNCLAKKSLNKSKLIVLAKLIFPSYQRMIKKYFYLSEKPYLLPVAWIQRGIVIVSGRPDDVKKCVKRIITGDQVSEIKKSLQEFGLQ